MILAGDIALTIALITELVFVVTYWVMYPTWWHTEVGFHLMTEAIVLLGVLVFLFVAVQIRSVPPDPATPRVFIYAAVAGITFWRWTILLRSQRVRRQSEAAKR